MTHERRADEPADLVLSAALRDALPEPPFDQVDWRALHARVESRARPLLLRPRRPLLHLLGSWSRCGSLLAAAAAAAMTLLLAGPAVFSSGAGAGDTFRTVEEELAEAVPVSARTLLVAAGEPESMLDAVLFYDPEEW